MSREKHKWYVITKGPRHSYARVVHTDACPLLPRFRNARVWDRNPLDERDTSGTYPCQFCKPEPSPETIAKQKVQLAAVLADAEAAEAERQRVRDERRGRLASMRNYLGSLFAELKCEGDRITFSHVGVRYEIREIA